MRSRVGGLLSAGLAGLALWGSGGCAPSRCDTDHDGYEAVRCGGDDCNDATYLAHPGAAEICDLLDNDCDGVVDGPNVIEPPTWYRDSDGDGYGDSEDSLDLCSAPSGYVNNDLDCDDTRTLNRPGGLEICDEADNDCDGEVDEDVDFAPEWYPDSDGDGYGDPAGPVAAACSVPAGHAAAATDCDDDDPTIHPGAEEICGDEIDNNCDGTAGGCSGLVGDLLLAGASAISWTTGEPGANLGSSLALAALGEVGETTLVVGRPAFGAGDGGGVVLIDVDGLDGSSAERVIVGQTADNFFGQSVVTGGDANGDGQADLLVHTGDDSLAFSWAQVQLFAGPLLEGGLDSDALASGQSDVSSGDFGRGLAFLPDWDDDGDDEIVVSEPRWDAEDESSSGRVLIFEGGADLDSLDPADADFVLSSASTGVGWFGMDVATGDFNGDGLSDLAVGSPGSDPYGQVQVFFGPFVGNSALASEADLVISGAFATPEVGQDLANGGDLDGAPGDELLIGGFGRSFASNEVSVALWVHAADSAGALEARDGLASLQGPVSFFGLSENLSVLQVARLGDLDGDGSPELGVLGLHPDWAGTGLTVFAGPVAGEQSFADAQCWIAGIPAAGFAPTGWVFEPVLGPGDLDGDGYDDLLVGAPGDPLSALQGGAVHLLRGGPGL